MNNNNVLFFTIGKRLDSESIVEVVVLRGSSKQSIGSKTRIFAVYM